MIRKKYSLYNKFDRIIKSGGMCREYMEIRAGEEITMNDMIG